MTSTMAYNLEALGKYRNLKKLLITALDEKNINDFKKHMLTMSSRINLRSYSEDIRNIVNACLQIARQGDRSFTKVLFESMCKVNPNFAKCDCNFPIHCVIVIGCPTTLHKLLMNNDLDVNFKFESLTPLLFALELMKNHRDDLIIVNKYEEIMKILLNAGCDVNIPDGEGVTAIYQAAEQNFARVIQLMYEYSGKPIDLDSYKVKELTARNILGVTLPDLLNSLTEDITLFNRLNNDIVNLDEASFASNFKVYVRGEDPASTLLTKEQLCVLLEKSCDKGLEEVVSQLLSKGVDPAYKMSNCDKGRPTRTAAHSACRRGYHRILKLLLDHTDSNDIVSCEYEHSNVFTLFHIITLNMKNDGDKNESINHMECLEIVCNLIGSEWINVQDNCHNTPLHYAAKAGNEKAVLALLRNGACVSIENDCKVIPLALIESKILKSYLDECITTNSKLPNDMDFEIRINYNFLGLKGCDRNGSSDTETKALLYMKENENLWPLLQHPVITSFLYLKWQRTGTIFIAHLILYLIFCIFLYAHIYLGPTCNTITSLISRLIAMLILPIFIVIELLQFFLSPRIYLTSFENLLEITLFVNSCLVLCMGDSISPNIWRQLAAVTILMSATDLLMLLGRFPSVSTAIVMLKTVSLNFLKFFSLYSMLVIAFAFSFHTLFADIESQTCKNYSTVITQGNDTNEDFLYMHKSLFRTFIMLTGELDAGDFKFGTVPITSRVIFVIFVFMIPIVLLNLLNGLAVSDTQAIQRDAEVWGHINRITDLQFIEDSIFIASQNENILCRCITAIVFLFLRCGCRNGMKNRVALLPDHIPTLRIVIGVNDERRRVFIEQTNGDIAHIFGTIPCLPLAHGNERMPTKIIEDAKQVISDKERFAQLKNLFSQLDTVEHLPTYKNE